VPARGFSEHPKPAPVRPTSDPRASPIIIMVAAAGPWPFTSRASVSRSRASTPTKCWCETRIDTGAPGFLVESLRGTVESVFLGRIFCSEKCVRAFCLEALNILDGLDTPKSRSVVRDLHELYHGLAETFVDIVEETRWLAPEDRE
jgi:hypothetical protein